MCLHCHEQLPRLATTCRPPYQHCTVGIHKFFLSLTTRQSGACLIHDSTLGLCPQWNLKGLIPRIIRGATPAGGPTVVIGSHRVGTVGRGTFCMCDTVSRTQQACSSEQAGSQQVLCTLEVPPSTVRRVCAVSTVQSSCLRFEPNPGGRACSSPA